METSTSTSTTTTGMEQQQLQGREKHQYQYKKLGDLMDEVDDLLLRRREELMKQSTEKVNNLLKEIKQLYGEIKQLMPKQPIDSAILTEKQNHLNQIENQAVQGVFGAEAQIDPLDQEGQPMHHVRIEAIPPGQATIRHLIERCHQMLTRILDRVEKMSTRGQELGTGTAAGTGRMMEKKEKDEMKEQEEEKNESTPIIQQGPGAGVSAH